ncbi:MAG TPA: hypothetical protein VFY36_12745 [Solirubrobacteraceae bacterium]|nr:hypothetical protein [Solirubrobacteraceae bacterium]
MLIQVGARTLRTPSGEEWRVGRRWIGRELPRWRKVRVGKLGNDAASYMPGAVDLEELGLGFAILIGGVVVAVVLIPLLLFGVELITVGFLIAASILGRSLLGRPWVIRAAPVDGGAEALIWKVVGWRRSSRLIDEVATALAAGTTPPPASHAA